MTQGTVRLHVDVSRGRVSRASSVLDNLGHSPEMDWLSVNGMTPTMAATRIGVDKRRLKDTLMNVPGVLDVRLSDGRIEIQKMWITDPNLRQISDQHLKSILGEGFRLSLLSYFQVEIRPSQIAWSCDDCTTLCRCNRS